MTKSFLDNAYSLEGPDAVTAFYEDWAGSYDAEIQENGYVTPRRCAQALASLAADPGAPVLDVGCGTGLSGLALRAAGFTSIDGVDISAAMLAQARARQGVYRKLIQITLGEAIPAQPGEYAHINAAGVISPDHAPPETVDALLQVLPSGGCLMFSLNDHALAVAAFPEAVARAVADGRARLEFEEYGDHLPGIDLRARVYGLRKP